jgi:predicted outer membrane repeat protein
MYTQCESELVEVCQTSCEDKGGAIFCDGQFINAADAKSCSAELKAKLKIDVAVSAVVGAAGEIGDATKGAAACTKEKASGMCSVGLIGGGGGPTGLGLLGTALGALYFGRRRSVRSRAKTPPDAKR